MGKYGLAPAIFRPGSVRYPVVGRPEDNATTDRDHHGLRDIAANQIQLAPVIV